MDKESDERKRKKARARKKALAIPTRDKMIKSPPVSKAEGEEDVGLFIRKTTP